MRQSHDPEFQKAFTYDANLGKLPPQAIDLEEAVIGALLLHKTSQPEVLSFLEADDFYKEPHQRIFTAIKELLDASRPVDLRTVRDQLTKTGFLEVIGGAYYLAEVTSKVSNVANIEAHARIVKEYSLKRKVITIAMELTRDGYDDQVDAFNLIEKMDKALQQIANSVNAKSQLSMKEGIISLAKEINARKENKTGVTGIPSGMYNLDRLTHGWQNTDFILIASRPGMGKTSFIISALRNAGVNFQRKGAIISLEMGAIQLIMKFATLETEITLKDMRSKQFDEKDWAQFTNKTIKLIDAPIWIDDSSSMTVFQLKATGRKLKQQYGIEYLVIDYLQLLKGDKDTIAKGNREQEISSISRALKGIAKELGIPVIALSQLSRAVETRGGAKIPMLADLRESGSLEQDADVVIFLWRPEYYNIKSDNDGEFVPGLTKAIIAKHRNGALGEAFLQFVGKTTEFKDAEHVYLGQETVTTVTLTALIDSFHTPNPKPSDDDMPF